MKVSAIVIFVMSMWLGAAARALPLLEYQASAGDTLDLYVSGSSAQDNSLQRLFRLLCEADSLDVYHARRWPSAIATGSIPRTLRPDSP